MSCVIDGICLDSVLLGFRDTKGIGNSLREIRHSLFQDGKELGQCSTDECGLLVQNVDDEIGIQVIKVNEKLIWMLHFDIPSVERSVGEVP